PTGAVFGRATDRTRDGAVRLRQHDRQRRSRSAVQYCFGTPDEYVSADCRGEVAAAHSAALWPGCDSRIPDGVSDSTGTGLELGSAFGGAGSAGGGTRGIRERDSLDIFSDGGHCAGRTVGPHGGGRRRRSVSRVGDGARLRAWSSGSADESSG